jgi:hypothetical protein
MSKPQLLLVTLGSATLTIFLFACTRLLSSAPTNATVPENNLRVAIAPYQDMALLANIKGLGLEKKYGTKIELFTMPWEDIIPAVASGGKTVDIGFASLADYMCKSERLNNKGDDALLYIYPAYVFRGGAFITFNPLVPVIDAQSINNSAVIKKFLSYKIGVQKNSCCHMLLWLLAHNAGIQFSSLPIIDTTLNDGLLAAENGGLDAAAAGLTQRTEALKLHGRVLVDMDAAGLVDITGFVCKESVYRKRKQDIESLIKMWCECAHYVLSDLDHHSAASLAYLKTNASTQYTADEFKKALSLEYFPQSLAAADRNIIADKSKYSIKRISALCSQYLFDTGATKTIRPAPDLVIINKKVAGAT